MDKKKIFVAMSGGVDSSVTAALLHRQGHEVVGGTMSLWENADPVKNNKRCCGITEVYGAKRVCDVIGIPHYTFNMKEDFRKRVINDFIDEYKKGRTPNPCVRCNEFMKFDILLEKARNIGCEYIATGHYAKIIQEDGDFYLKKGDDGNKDQSYFLYPIKEIDLPYILFPLSDLSKSEVRDLAAEYNLPTAKKPESQDICFIPRDHVAFIEKHGAIEAKKGKIVDKKTGKSIGEHTGVHQYTIGQRKGLGVAANRPIYVEKIDVENNIVYVSDDEDLYGNSFEVGQLNILSSSLWSEDKTYQVKVRYRSTAKPCKVTFSGEGRCEVKLLEKERGITPGQGAVFYFDDTVIAGGEIC